MEEQAYIDRRLLVPANVQLSNILMGQIARGVYLPGSRLPTELELCRRYKVSRMTVRRSIKTLLDHGIVSTIQGSGTYVKSPDLGGVTFNLEDFLNIFYDREVTRVKILEARTAKADEITAKKLGIYVGKRTILIRRIITREGDPILYHKEYLIFDPMLPIVEAELEVTALHGLFVGRGDTRLKSGDLKIQAAVLSKEEAEVLNTMQMQPAFLLEHIFYDLDDEPVSWGKFICRGDHFEFRAKVGIRNRK